MKNKNLVGDRESLFRVKENLEYCKNSKSKLVTGIIGQYGLYAGGQKIS